MSTIHILFSSIDLPILEQTVSSFVKAFKNKYKLVGPCPREKVKNDENADVFGVELTIADFPEAAMQELNGMTIPSLVNVEIT